MGVLQDVGGERCAAADALQLVGDLEGDLCDARPIGISDVAARADDRTVARIDRSNGLVMEAVDIGEVDKLPRRQFGLR